MPIEIHGDAAALFTAIAAAQSQMEGVKKAAKNPHFRSRYADLSAVIEASVPPLNDQGIAVLQLPGWDDDIKHVTLATVLGHGPSGAYLVSTASTPADKSNAQGVGSAITYLRRYSLQAAVALPAEDDDGNMASQRRGGGQERRQPQRQAKPPAQQERPAAPRPGPTTGHHDSWEGNRARFCADLKAMGFQYESIAAWCEAHNRGRPSTWDTHRRGRLIDWLGDSGNSVQVKAWVTTEAELAAARKAVTDG
jgi:hypothetical protein